jgi:hypothetical protein
MLKVIAILALGLLLMGCASPTVVERERPEDYRLTCVELEREMRDADDFREKAQRERGVTGTNVAAAVFFWPAIVGTYANVEEATRAAEDRKKHLMNIYRDKGCAN